MTATPSVAWRELFDRAADHDVSVEAVCDELAARRDE
jgi:hypothetical protein